MENEKYKVAGQSMGAVGTIITLVTGVGVAVMVMIFVGSLSGQTYQVVESDLDTIGHVASIVNQSFVADNVTATTLSSYGIVPGTLTISNVTQDFGLGNFTISYSSGTVLLTGHAFNGTAMNATYTSGNYTIQNHVKNGIISSFDAFEQTGSYLPIIVLAVVIAVVLGLVLGFTAFGGSRGGSSGTAL